MTSGHERRAGAGDSLNENAHSAAERKREMNRETLCAGIELPAGLVVLNLVMHL